MAFIEDFTPFLSLDEFAIEVVYLAGGVGPGYTVSAIFDMEYQPVLDDLAAAAAPAMHCSVGDVPNARRGDRFVVHGVGYELVEPMPDGTGWQTLRLRKAV